MTNPHTNLVKKAIKHYLETGTILKPPENLPKAFYKKAGGVFVTLYKNQELRGCVGTPIPVYKNLGREIINNAITASQKDTRFFPVTLEEIPKLTYEVSILSKLKPVTNIKKLDPKKYGLIVSSSFGRSSLLLPNLAGIKTSTQLLEHTCLKGDIDPENDPLEIFKFTTKKYKKK
jgi:AmmeMemoRadiSam system protein A